MCDPLNTVNHFILQTCIQYWVRDKVVLIMWGAWQTYKNNICTLMLYMYHATLSVQFIIRFTFLLNLTGSTYSIF